MSGDPAPTRRTRVLAFDTHPIQYRGPLFAALAADPRIDFSAAFYCGADELTHLDRDFGTIVSAEPEVLCGYRHRFMGRGRIANPPGFLRFSGSAGRVLDEERPDIVVLNTLDSALSWQVLLGARRRGIPLWLRVETQDEARTRSAFKRVMRGLVYRLAYRGVAGAFAIGQLNRAHLLRHGFQPRQIVSTPYATPDRIAPLGQGEAQRRRDALRAQLGVADDARIIGFFGKLIDKKDPCLLVDALAIAQRRSPVPLMLLVVGHGPLDADLRARVAAAGVRAHFAGFVPQSRIADYYLAADIVALPSKRAGETWGLVVNEALQAGCTVVVSDAVGCAADFGHLAHVEIVPTDDAEALAEAITRLASVRRTFGWCADTMAIYSVAHGARQMADALAGAADKAGAAG